MDNFWRTYYWFEELSPEDTKTERIRHGQEIAKIVGAEKSIFLDLGDGMIRSISSLLKPSKNSRKRLKTGEIFTIKFVPIGQ